MRKNKLLIPGFQFLVRQPSRGRARASSRQLQAWWRVRASHEHVVKCYISGVCLSYLLSLKHRLLYCLLNWAKVVCNLRLGRALRFLAHKGLEILHFVVINR